MPTVAFLSFPPLLSILVESIGTTRHFAITNKKCKTKKASFTKKKKENFDSWVVYQCHQYDITDLRSGVGRFVCVEGTFHLKTKSEWANVKEMLFCLSEWIQNSEKRNGKIYRTALIAHFSQLKLSFFLEKNTEIQSMSCVAAGPSSFSSCTLLSFIFRTSTSIINSNEGKAAFYLCYLFTEKKT